MFTTAASAGLEATSSSQKLPCLNHTFQRGLEGIKNCLMQSTTARVLGWECFPLILWTTHHEGMCMGATTCWKHGTFLWALCIMTGSLFSTVTDLQEEGKSAINSPMAPASVDIHPEDTQLGTVATWLSLLSIPGVGPQMGGWCLRTHILFRDVSSRLLLPSSSADFIGIQG